MDRGNIIVIVGPTASGKTSLSIELAKKFNGEVISADSRQVYRGLDLGTGKVTQEEMRGIPHHLLDVADPREQYTAHDFVRDASKAISDITSRGCLPIIAGGTFLYIDALLGRFSMPEVSPNHELRQKLEMLTTEKLFEMLKEKDATRAEHIDRANRRRLIRALEVIEALGTVPAPRTDESHNVLTLGIAIDRDTLHHNIHTRLIERLKNGMIEEVEKLHACGLSYERMDELGLEYRYIAKFLQGEISREKMIELIDTKSRQFAKRQMTWLKRDKTIHWVQKNDFEQILKLVDDFLK